MEGKIDAPKRFSVRWQHVRVRVLVLAKKKKKSNKLANNHFAPCSNFILLELINEEVVSLLQQDWSKNVCIKRLTLSKFCSTKKKEKCEKQFLTIWFWNRHCSAQDTAANNQKLTTTDSWLVEHSSTVSIWRTACHALTYNYNNWVTFPTSSIKSKQNNMKLKIRIKQSIDECLVT